MQVTDWFTNWRARHWKRLIAAINERPAEQHEAFALELATREGRMLCLESE
jgi:hypothetical protein